MSTIVDCPSCSRKLRVPEELLGKKVKCPTCSGTFDAVAAPEPAGMPLPSSPTPSASVEPRIHRDPQLELGNESRTSPTQEESSPLSPSSSPSDVPAGSSPVSEQETLLHPGGQPPSSQELAV